MVKCQDCSRNERWDKSYLCLPTLYVRQNSDLEYERKCRLFKPIEILESVRLTWKKQ